MMNEINENVEYYEAEIMDENSENSGSGRGLIIGGVTLGVGALVAGATAIANKKGVFKDIKTNYRIKKLEKIDHKRAKLYAKIEAGSVEEETEEEE